MGKQNFVSDSKNKLNFIAFAAGIAFLGSVMITKVLLAILNTAIPICILFWKSISPSLAASIVQFFSSDIGNAVLETLFGCIAGISIILILRSFLKIRIKEFFNNPYHPLEYTAKGSVCYLSFNYICSLASAVIISVITAFIGSTAYAPEFTATPAKPAASAVTFIYTIILAPIIEEIIFRGFILRSLQKYGNIFAIIISSALFAAYHENLTQALPIMLASIILGYIAIRSNSILPTIIIHAVNNLMSMFILWFSHTSFRQNFETIFLLFILIILIVGLFIMIHEYNHNRLKIHNFNISGMTTKTCILAFISSPPMLIFGIYSIAMLIKSIL